MDKKLTFTGGEPNLNIDDILRDPIANRAALFGLMLGLGSNTDLVISGAAVTVDPLVDASVTGGYIWLNGEILQVDAATVVETQGTDLWEFQKLVTYDSNGDKTFNDGTPRQTWQKNRAVLVNVATVTGLNAVTAPTLKAVFLEATNARLDNLELDTGWLDMTAGTDVTIVYAKAIRRGDYVTLTAAFSVNSGSGATTILNLPAGVPGPDTPSDLGVSVVSAKQNPLTGTKTTPVVCRIRLDGRVIPLDRAHFELGDLYELSSCYTLK